MNNRRTFLTITSLAAGSVAAGAAPGSTAEQKVFSLVSNYGHTTQISRTAEHVTIRARIDSHPAFADTFTGSDQHPIKKIHAAGNRLSFKLDGIDFQIDHLA